MPCNSLDANLVNGVRGHLSSIPASSVVTGAVMRKGKPAALDSSWFPALSRRIMRKRRRIVVHGGPASQAAVCAPLFSLSAFSSLRRLHRVRRHLTPVQGCFNFSLFLAIEVMCGNLDFGLQFMLQHVL